LDGEASSDTDTDSSWYTPGGEKAESSSSSVPDPEFTTEDVNIWPPLGARYDALMDRTPVPASDAPTTIEAVPGAVTEGAAWLIDSRSGFVPSPPVLLISTSALPNARECVSGPAADGCTSRVPSRL
jgi:hypothetical protein